MSFDNIEVVYYHGAEIEEDHYYYPFGLNLQVVNPIASMANNIKYNSKELQHNEFTTASGVQSGLEWEDYGARMQDPQIGRWLQIDPLSAKYPNISPYVYCSNNPISLIDIDGRDWFYYSKGGKKNPTWNWQDGNSYHTGINDANGKEVVLKGAEAVIVFDGSRSESLGVKDGKPGYIDGAGAKTADVTFYGPKGENDIQHYTGFTMGSNAAAFGAISEGTYNGDYSKIGKSGSLPSHWDLNNAGPVREMDGLINPYDPSEVDKNGEGYKTGIYIHSTNQNGFAGTTHKGTSGVSVGCLLLAPGDFRKFNSDMMSSGIQHFKVQVIRDGQTGTQSK